MKLPLQRTGHEHWAEMNVVCLWVMIDEKDDDCILLLWLSLAKEDTPLFDQAFYIVIHYYS